MSDRYKGAILSPTAPTVTPQSAGGIYTLSQQTQYQGQGVWPTAVNYPINNSLRFRASASAYLNRTPASAGNRQIFSFACWVKRGTLGTDYILSVRNGTGAGVGSFYIGFRLDQLQIVSADSAGNIEYLVRSAAVYRDPSAWYHIVCAVDTTQATSSNRVKIYVNGVQVTALDGASSYPTQNLNSAAINTTVPHYFGREDFEGGTAYHDYYLTEIYFIDGTALTPSSFGTTDAYGIWQPIPYTGAYGTNGYYLPFTDNSALTTSSNVGLGKDFSGNGNYWVTNNISITAGSTYDSMKDVPTNTNSNTANYCVLNPIFNVNGTNVTYSNGNLTFSHPANSGNAQLMAIRGTIALPAGKYYWEYIVGATVNDQVGIGNNVALGGSPDGTAGARYLNSGAFQSNYTNPSSAASYTTNDIIGVAYDQPNGTLAFYKNNSLQGTITNISTTEIFFPSRSPSSSGTGGAGSFNFGQQPFSYTPPTGFLPLNTYNLPTPTILAGNQYMDATTFTAPIGVGGTGGGRNGANSGTGGQGAGFSGVLSSSGTQLVIAAGGGGGGGGGGFGGGNNGGAATAGGAGSGAGGSGYSGSGSGGSMTNGSGGGGAGGSDAGSGTSGGGAGGTNVLTGTNTTSTNGSGTSVANSGDPNYVANRGNGGATSSTGTSSVNTGQNGLVWIQYPATGGTTATYSSAAETLFTVPTGITSLRVKAWGAGGSSGFGAVSATGGAGGGGGFAQADITVTPGQVLTIVVGTGGRQYGSKSITNAASFQPDFVWLKDRTNAYDHILTDSVRGVNNSLVSNSTNAESSTTLYLLSAFNSNGFNVSSIADAATLNDSLVGWQWRASNVAGVSNTNGTITSTVSANTTAGFSIVTYTGTGANATVGHGLGVAPSMVILKRRDAAAYNWMVWQSTLTGLQFLNLDTTGSVGSNSAIWNSTIPTSTVFSLGNNANLNASGGTYVAYCFSAVAGYSAFGSYTGNGSTDGPFVYTGFRPAMIWTKPSSTTGPWNVLDNKRGPYNVNQPYLQQNTSSAEATVDYVDFLSNGFKIRYNAASPNANGDTILYVAFAENPFKIARAR
jgi:hypothetical protein